LIILNEEALTHLSKKTFSFGSGRATVEAVMLMFPIGIGIATPYYLLWKNSFSLERIQLFLMENPGWPQYGTVIGLLVIVTGILVHELIHGITWAAYSENGWRSIRFGVLWKSMTPYSHCTEVLTVKQYIIGAMMPSIILGIIPSLIACISGNFFFFSFGFFFTMAAAGDFMIVRALSQHRMDDLVKDHPDQIGFTIYQMDRK
jgi:hypothetical protein